MGEITPSNHRKFKEPQTMKSFALIRPMEVADIEAVVAIHLASFPDSRSSRLGKPFLRKMYTWYLLNQPKLAFVAILGQDVLGFVTGTYGWGGGGKRFRYTFWQILWGFVRQPALLFSPEMFEQSLSLFKGLFLRRQAQVVVIEDRKGVKVTLDSIAVSLQARGQNLGVRLIESFENSARQLGGGYLALGVEYDNLAARRLYENCGWHVVHEDKGKNTASYHKIILET
jgi:ribosomal protein S18 acetylase RimI-like enzyme